VREPTTAELEYAVERSGTPLTTLTTFEELADEGVDNPALSLWAVAFKDDHFRGDSAFMNLPREATPRTYLPVPSEWLKLPANAVHDAITSVRLSASEQEAASVLYLFEDSRYRGGYLSVFVDPGSVTEIADLKPYGFNDITSSLVLIRGFENEFIPLSVGSILRPRLAAFVEEQDRVRLRGYPVVTWDMWPSFAPSQEFVYVRVPLRVDVDNWFDYDAELRFWIYFFVGADALAYGTVYYYELWVSDGILEGRIRDRLEPVLDQGAVVLSQYIGSALEVAQSFPMDRIVLHPGNPFAFGGNVDDDVGIIFVTADQPDEPEGPKWPRFPGQVNYPSLPEVVRGR
jgi:hypothetical protein